MKRSGIGRVASYKQTKGRNGLRTSRFWLVRAGAGSYREQAVSFKATSRIQPTEYIRTLDYVL